MNNEKCFEIGTLQSFIDGELASEISENVIKHIALCDGCATLLAETEEENTFAFSVLDDELNVLVPTERLRTKVFASIREIEEKASWWQKLTTNFGFLFKSPSLVAFASVVLFACTLAIGLKYYQPDNLNENVAVNEEKSDVEQTKPQSQVTNISDIIDEVVKKDVENVESPKIAQVRQNEFRVIKTGGLKNENSESRSLKNVQENENPKPKAVNIKNAEPIVSPNLSGEDSYLQTIETLSRTVDSTKDLTMRPAERVNFERDLAIVDNAIKKTKEEVRKNPKNQAAREVLRASYQNKIDLLNSVAEKNDLMASIQ